MTALALSIYVQALTVAMEIALPIVGAVALIGIIVGFVQAAFQIQDQNVAFAPKLAGVAACAALAGPAGFGLLLSLFSLVVAASVRLAAP